MNELNKKYGLVTAICMVVGIVVGSGVFFKSEKILNATQGNLYIGLLAILLGGLVMLACVYVFSLFARKYEKVNGVVDYAEATIGSTYGYLVGWFLCIIYYPTLTVTVSWICARYTAVLFGWNVFGPETLVLTAFYLIFIFALNVLAPIIAGKFLVSTVVIKLIPLILMSVIGPIIGLKNGVLTSNFVLTSSHAFSGNDLFTALTATIFSYEGWVIATSINSEIKDSKRNLPKALLIGSFIVIIIYVFYFLGLTGAVTKQTIMANGENASILAFSNIFSHYGGVVLITFVILSSLGTLNGLMIGTCRGIYSLAARGMGPKPNVFKHVDNATSMPTNSSVFGLLLCGFWLLYFYVSQLTEVEFLDQFMFDITELPIISIYALYIPMFIMFMVKEKSLNCFKRFIAPILGIIACLFTICAAYVAHQRTIVYYIVFFVVAMAIGYFLKGSKNRINSNK